MRRSILFWLALAGCGDPNSGSTVTPAGTSSAAAATRGGTISVGDASWTLVPSRQCSVYPGSIVNIAGHAAEDESLEIVIDFGGPNQVRIGGDGNEIWRAVRDSIEMVIDGQRVRGTADFTKASAGGVNSAVSGSWDVSC